MQARAGGRRRPRPGAQARLGLGWIAPMARASAFSPVIRGRDAELDALGELLGSVRAGSGAVLVIEGAPGMGKSRLLAEGEKMAHRLGFPVGIGVAEPSEAVAELALLLRALFDGPQPLLDRAGLTSLHTGAGAALLAAAGSAVAARARRAGKPATRIPGRRAVGRQRHRSRVARAATASRHASDRMGRSDAPR